MASVPPPHTLLLGAAGAGKSHSIHTLAKAGLDVFLLVTEPTGLDTILDVWEKEKVPLEKLHYHVVTPTRVGFENLKAVAERISVGNFKSLSELPPSGDRTKGQWLELLKVLADFTCERDGKSYGSVDKFDESKCFVLDSLSGPNLMAMDLVLGDKVSAHQGEWGLAMGLIEKLIYNLTSNCKCPLVITGHLEREQHELTGAMQIQVATLGKKLSPRLPKFFSEVVMAYREDRSYFWSTSAPNVDLKHRSLPLGDKLAPSFEPIIKRWHERKAFAKGTT